MPLSAKQGTKLVISSIAHPGPKFSSGGLHVGTQRVLCGSLCVFASNGRKEKVFTTELQSFLESGYHFKLLSMFV